MNSVQNPAFDSGMEVRFAAAARHSRMVRTLRVAVPAAVVLALASIVAIQVFYNPFQQALSKLPVDMGNVVVSGTKITMETPHLAGFSTDQRPYELWAKAAIQDLANPDQVEKLKTNPKVFGWFVGQVMKATQGQANPQLVNQVLKRKLEQY